MTENMAIVVDEQEGLLFGPFASYELATEFLNEVYEQSNINISDFNIHELTSVEEWVTLFQDVFPNPTQLISKSK